MIAKSILGKRADLARRLATAVVAAGLLAALAPAALGQVGSLYYKEVEKDGRIYVFNTPERYATWQASGEMGQSITLIGRGPKGETVVAENETAIDLFNFKHGLEAYDRPTPKPAPAAAPMTLKVGEGELKFGLLLQPWYVMDDSPTGSTSTGYYGNVVGNNTFRIRRAEIKLSGKINSSFGFEVMVDPAKKQEFTASGVPVTDDKILQDLAVSYIGLKGHEFAIGQKKIVITEEGVRSSSELDFAERARVTRTFSDRRETGLFYKGAFGEKLGLMASVTNGTRANTPSASNDVLFSAVRLDVKPVPALVVGASGGTGAADNSDRLNRSIYGAHVRFDGTEKLPLLLRAEYLAATGERIDASGAPAPDLKRDGYYGSALYTFAKKYRIGARYDEIDNDKDAPGKKIKTTTAGFHYLPMGKNVNFKFEWAKVTEEGRQIGGELAEDYNVGLIAAQIAF